MPSNLYEPSPEQLELLRKAKIARHLVRTTALDPAVALWWVITPEDQLVEAARNLLEAA